MRKQQNQTDTLSASLLDDGPESSSPHHETTLAPPGRGTQANLPQPIGMGPLIKGSFFSQFPFSISVAAAGNTFLISTLLAKMSADTIACGVFITSLQNLMVGVCRASLASNSLMIGIKNGEASAAKRNNNLAAETDAYREIGRVLQQGWVFATLLSAGATGLLLLSENALKLVGVDKNIARMTQAYFREYVIGIWPLLHSFADQQLSVGTKDPWLPAVRGLAYGFAVYGFSLMATEGCFGESYTGIEGIGFGSALAAWAIFLFTKLMHLHTSIRKYELYQCQSTLTQAKKHLTRMCSIGLKLGIQVAAEWINLVGMSLLIGHMPEENAIAAQPSFQILTMLALFSLGQAVCIGAVVSHEIGVLSSSERQYHDTLDTNIKRKGYGGIALGLVVPLAVSITGFIKPNLFTANLLRSNASAAEHQLAERIMRVNAVGISIDAFRSIGTGPLRGFADINYATVISFLLMTVVGITVQGIASFSLDANLEDFFWIRNGVTLCSGALIFARGWKQLQVPPHHKPCLRQVHVKQGQTCAAIFQPEKALKQVLSPSIEDLENGALDNSVRQQRQ